jgi:NhaP-type Na+/H+ or K+/H+ antiporter
MEITTAIIFIGLLVFSAHFFEWLFRFFRIPAVLLLMCIGILLGPILHIVSPDFLGRSGNVIVTLVLVIILFEGSVQLKISSLRKNLFSTVSLAFLSFFFTMFGIGFLLWHFAGLPVITSFLIGSILGSNSTAIVIPLIQRVKIEEKSRTTLFLESGISDVLSIVFTLALISSLELGAFHLDGVIYNIIISILLATIIGISFAFLWSLILNKIQSIQNSSFATPAFVFIIFGLTEKFGLSGLITVIAFGIFLGNIPSLLSLLEKKHRLLYRVFHPKPLSEEELSFFREVVFLTKIFFFIFIGISLNFENFYFLFLGLSLTIFIFIIRLLAVSLSVSRTTYRFDASIMAITVPRGLAPAVLALIPIQKGLANGEMIQDITYSVIFFSLFLTSIFIFLLYNTFLRKIYQFFLLDFAPDPEDGSLEYPKEK